MRVLVIQASPPHTPGVFSIPFQVLLKLMLIVYEQFGMQDSEGCDRAYCGAKCVVPNFSCILTVTQRDQFNEAFQKQLKVCKIERGSQLSISM
jgi:exonuclease SbcC